LVRERRQKFVLHTIEPLRLLARMTLRLQNALLLPLELFALANITGDFGCTNNLPGGITNRRNRQRDVHQLPIAAATPCLEMINFFTIAQLADDLRFFAVAIAG